MSAHLLEVEINAEGDKLACLSPIDSDGNVQCGYRIAGPKAWGGSRNIARLTITTDDLVAYIKQYAPDVVVAIQKSANDGGTLCDGGSS